MKDRTPKFPGRVKLDPVAGQTNIYDMTRADDPDDTGTPFNTRTMLQDSTARFLRIPVSNPFVDDALRHMPDRINPIGTIRTSPALSLGDAWLPCDGSQVTFAEYPQLFQMLRKTVSSVTWTSVTLAADLNYVKTSRFVFFNGNWYVAISGRSGNNSLLRIYRANAIGGTWELVKTFSVQPLNITYSGVGCALAASDELLLAAWREDITGSDSTIKLYGTTDGESWTSSTLAVDDSAPHAPVDLVSDGAYWLLADNASGALYGTNSPLSAAAWTAITQGNYSSPSQSLRLSYEEGKFWKVELPAIKYSNPSAKLKVYSSASPTAGWRLEFDGSKKIPELLTSRSKSLHATKVIFYANRYWLAYQLIDSGTTAKVLAFSGTEQFEVFDTANEGAMGTDEDIAASEKMIALSCNKIVITSSEPSAGFAEPTLPADVTINGVVFDGDISAANGNGVVMYHDYSTDTRLLPTISLSDDTTTFIKAKNELDVFEAQQSGGD